MHVCVCGNPTNAQLNIETVLSVLTVFIWYCQVQGKVD